MTKAAGKKLIAERVDEFEKNKAALTKRGHGETNIRTNYIDVLFESLGWNMKSHYEVVREFSQKDTSGTKKVDYAFKVNGIACFLRVGNLAQMPSELIDQVSCVLILRQRVQ